MLRINQKPTNYQEIGESKNVFQVTRPVEQDEGTQKRGILSHVRRYWYYYVPGSLVGLAVFLIILFVVIIPAIVQGIVDKNDLPVYSAKLTAPGPNSVQISLASSIDTPTAFTTTLKPLNLGLAGENDTNVFTSIVLPEKILNGKTPIEVTDQTTTVTDIDSFESFLASAMYNKNFTMQVSGKSNIFLGAIKSPITLNKKIELAGLNNLTGFSLNNPQLLTTAQADGTNFLGTAVIPNPSVFSIELGNLTLNLAVNNFSIGNAAIENLYLAPGANNFPLKAKISLSSIVSNLNTIIALQPAFATNGTLEILATGNTTTFNGQRLAYYEKILSPLVLKSTLPVRQLLAGGSGASTSSGNSSTNSTTKSVNPLMAKLARRLDMASQPVNVGKKWLFRWN